jgi:Fe-S-cluster-containing dehydrogenase component
MNLSRRDWFKGLSAAGLAAAVAAPGAQAREAKTVHPEDIGMLYDSTRCVGCRACTTACKEANGLPPDVVETDGAAYNAPHDLSATNKSILKLYREGDTAAFVKRQCMHCADPACVSACMAGALHKMDNGIVAYDKSVCVGCRYCQIACAFDVPKFTWTEPLPLIVKCEMCRHRPEGPACCEACPRGAMMTGTMAALTEEAHRRVNGDPDAYDPKVYGEHEAGGLHVLYLTGKAVPFEKLGLPDVPGQPIPQTSETIQHTLYKGFVAPAALFGLFTFAQYFNERRRQAAEDAGQEDKS